MKDTIKAKKYYTLTGLHDRNTGTHITGKRVLFDGDKPIMVAMIRTKEEFVEERRENECFNLCEIFTTRSGAQYAYWRDEETDEDFLTLLRYPSSRGWIVSK